MDWRKWGHTASTIERKLDEEIHQIVISELNVKNKITTIGALALPVLRYSFSISNYDTQQQIHSSDCSTARAHARTRARMHVHTKYDT
jgi:hypothetical protein